MAYTVSRAVVEAFYRAFDTRDGDKIADFMGKAFAGMVAVVDGGKQGAGIKYSAIRILVVLVEHLAR